jgi:hypothetical protein
VELGLFVPKPTPCLATLRRWAPVNGHADLNGGGWEI